MCRVCVRGWQRLLCFMLSKKMMQSAGVNVSSTGDMAGCRLRQPDIFGKQLTYMHVSA